MEYKKDVQRTENISNFVSKKIIKTYPFGDNKMGERAYRRAERLVAAIHLLTNHLEPQEPIRAIVRQHSIGILSSMLDIRDEMRTVGSSKVHSIEASLRHLISLVRILAVSGFVSFENADVLTDALDDLGSFMETSRRSVLSENIRLSRDDLLGVVDTAQESIKDIKDKTYLKDMTNVKDKVQTSIDVPHKKDIDLNRRMQGIVEVLRGGTDLGIKEIGVNLPEYSEKMIQRDLADLIAMGHVKKIGLRRWSTYILLNADNSTKEVEQDSEKPLHV